MTNELLGPRRSSSDEGSIEASLAGGDFWRSRRPSRTPRTSPRGRTGLDPPEDDPQDRRDDRRREEGVRKPDEEISIAKDRKDWSDFVGRSSASTRPRRPSSPGRFLKDIRKCKNKEPFHVAANVDVGWGSCGGHHGEHRMKENRTVTWKEFGLPEWLNSGVVQSLSAQGNRSVLLPAPPRAPARALPLPEVLNQRLSIQNGHGHGSGTTDETDVTVLNL